MNYDQKLLVGKALKALMQSYNPGSDGIVFQNIYKSGTRSVKCYRTRMDAKTEMDLRLAVIHMMKAFGVKDYYVNLTKGNRWGGPGFIVRF